VTQQLGRADHCPERITKLVREHGQKLIAARHRIDNLALITLLLRNVA
jgi:hypothetical protein